MLLLLCNVKSTVNILCNAVHCTITAIFEGTRFRATYMSNLDFVVKFLFLLSHFMPLYILLDCCFCRREWKVNENSVHLEGMLISPYPNQEGNKLRR